MAYELELLKTLSDITNLKVEIEMLKNKVTNLELLNKTFITCSMCHGLFEGDHISLHKCK